MRRDLVSGILVIAGSLAMVLVMGLHPTAHDLMAPGGGGAHRSTMVHGLALVSVPVVFLGLLGAARRLGPSDLTAGALVAWGFGAVAVLGAAVASGFVATPLVGRMVAAEGATRDLTHALLAYTGLWNQAFAKVHVVAYSAGILLWSAAILKSRRMSRGLGIAGVVVGGAVLLALLSGRVRLDVHGAGMVAFAQSGWLIAFGVLLCCGEGPRAEPSRGIPQE